ncbi:hypothetical protein B0J12DRAFT_753392 [Macrophomina phaseolina]|uniref:G-protein coupled receptors family 2 profile 2 domain-containing protein n=1 Tax=Macrophomina phaseolina TaxID=35725 RepID=A0ABQ8GAK1_9PEZI|nr:hypothetical protein B0J12DRAFT_753392 [Macrophomina phaseolina]
MDYGIWSMEASIWINLFHNVMDRKPGAFSGAFAAFGGMMLVTWILVRALFMHLQICWDITPSKHHFIGANIAAWTVTISLVAAVLAHAGVSFRFGAYCHVNHTGSIATYWAWLLGLGGLAALFQLATFAYCVKVYLQAALLRAAAGGAPVSTTRSAESGGAPSALSSRSRSARARFRRLKQVLALQWRSLAIVALAVGTTAFVCAVFIVLDNEQEKLAFANPEALVPWIVCMILTRDNERCLDKTGPIIIPEEITVATLFVLSFVGVEAFFLLCRVEVFKAWWEFGARVLDREKKAGAALQTEMGLVERGKSLGWLTGPWRKKEGLGSGVSGGLVGKDRSLGRAVSAGRKASRAERMPSAVSAKKEEDEAEVSHPL